MWTCPKCNADFFQKHLWHSCGDYSVEAFLKGKSERGCELFWFFVNEYRKIGPIKLHPVKTRIAIMVQVRFSGVNKIGPDFIEGGFWLKRKISSGKFFKIEDFGNNNYVHRFRMSDPSFVDDEFRRYMKMAYEIGERKHIIRKRVE
jgi:hypothetical protein